MRYIWEESDIVCGQKVGLTNGAKEEFIIGYVYLEDHNRYMILTSLSDGMAILYTSKAELCKTLNEKFKPI